MFLISIIDTLWLRGERDDLVGDLVLGWDVSGFLSPPVAVCGRRLQLRHVMSSAASQVDVMVYQVVYQVV